MTKKYFTDREAAGRRLAQKLQHFKNENALILCIPRGGVPVGYEVARALCLPLDILCVKKIGHPLNPEYAIGAAGPDFYFTLPHSDVTEQYIVEEKHRVQEKLKTYELKLRGKKKPQSPEGKKIIIIDDGIATGLTLRAAIEMVRKNNPLSITVAVPVISEKAARMLEQESIELITLLIPDYFTGVGAFYAHFDQVEDEEVIRLLLESANIEGT